MLNLNRFYLKHYAMWRGVEFYFEPGITFVTGENRSGKSMLFRALSLILRSQVIKRGSSLSRLPKGATIGLDFHSQSLPWQARLTSSTLHLNQGGTDAGATGKKAPRDMLAAALALPVELFDSTICLSGTGNHPLIVGTPGKRLEWVSAVLDLTDAYDRKAAQVAADLEVAQLAANQLALVQDELDNLPAVTKLPNLEVLTANLERARTLADRYSKGARLIETYDALQASPEPARYLRQIERSEAELKSLRRAHRNAVAYEAEAERAALVTELKTKLARIPSEDVDATTLQTFTATLRTLHNEIESLRTQWASTDADRKAYMHFKAILATAPANLRAVVRETQDQQAVATRHLSSLRHIKGGSCPVCRAKLTEDRRRRLIEESEDLLVEASTQLERLRKYEQAEQEVSRLKAVVQALTNPPARVDLSPAVQAFGERVQQAQARDQIGRRLRDLQTAVGADLDPPEASAAELEEQALTVERRLTRARVKLEHSEQALKLVNRLADLFGDDWDGDDILEKAERLTRRVEELLVKVTQAESAIAEAARTQVRREQLQERVTVLEQQSEHLPELLELKEAMGNKGMRLTKIKELAQAFQAEFNNLIPLLWDDPFVVDVEVKPSGLELFATRNGIREDLDALSGSEMQGWKLITALCLIRLLPDRLRCNTIILDELESNMDAKTKRRFVSEYLPELRKYVDNIVLISPLDYQDLPLAATAAFTVVKQDNVSRLEKV